MTAPAYYPEYKPKDAGKFAAMEKLLGSATNLETFRQLVLLYTFDLSYDREDLLVVLTRIERERGWEIGP